jgi:hypothetical protein
LRTGFRQRGNRSIQIAVLRTKQFKPFSKLLLVHLPHSFVIGSAFFTLLRNAYVTPQPFQDSDSMVSCSFAARPRVGESLCGNHAKRRALMVSTHVQALQNKHAGLEAQLREEMNRPAPDTSTIQMLKKQKLQIKQELAEA